MSSYFGIYFGNTTITIAVFKDGKTDIISNDSGDRLTPSVVAYNQTEFTTGIAAKNSITHIATDIVINSKRLLDDQLTDEQLTEYLGSIPCQTERKNGVIQFCFGKNILLSVDDVIIHLFKKIFAIATSFIHSTSNIRVVLAVPCHFSSTSRCKLWSAAERAGFTVLQAINEPTAALNAYDICERNELVLVYRVGGISCDATVLQAINGFYSIVGTVHKTDLGGDLFTKLLADYVAKEFLNRWKLDPQESKKSMYKLKRAAEFGKHILSTKTATSIFIESLCDGVDWEQNMTRPRFESIIAPHLSKYLAPIRQVLDENNLKTIDIGRIIFCGGSCRIPKLQSSVQAMFPSTINVLGDRPDEIIAEGCARQAAQLETPLDPDCLHPTMDVALLAADLYICSSDNKEIKLHIPSETPLPAKIPFNCNDTTDLIVLEGGLDDNNILQTITTPNGTNLQAHITQERIIIEAV